MYLSTVMVNSNQFVLVTNVVTNQVNVYKAGVHFVVPIFDKVEYISAAKHNELYTQLVPQVQLNGKLIESVVITYLVNWQVIDPLLYYNARQQQSGAWSAIAQHVKLLVMRNMKVAQNIESLQMATQLTTPLDIATLGIRIHQLNVVQVELPAHYQLVTTESMTTTNSASDLILESAYYEAQQIIKRTSLAKAQLFDNLPKSNIKFYDYFRRLEAYRENDTCTVQLPALDKIYLP